MNLVNNNCIRLVPARHLRFVTENATIGQHHFYLFELFCFTNDELVMAVISANNGFEQLIKQSIVSSSQQIYSVDNIHKYFAIVFTLLPLKAHTENFHFVLIVAPPVDKSGGVLPE